MASVRGRSDLKRYLASRPKHLRQLLRGAGRAGATVIADEAKARTTSQDVREGVVIKTKAEDTRVVVKVAIKAGWARSVANWLEYGTAPHFISVDDSQRGGMSVRKVNDKTKEGSLMIGGNFVGATVHHPGARPHPFLRPALDAKEAEAIAAAQSYINTGGRRGGAAAGEDDA